MKSTVDYGPAGLASQATGSSVSHTTETDLLTLKASPAATWLAKSQLTVYIKQTLGSASKVSYGYYYSFDQGTTWFKVPVKDVTTNKGNLVDVPTYVDSNSPSQSGVIQVIEDLPSSGCNAFKITGLAATADAGAYAITVLARDN
jgi:hypothetical protein